MTCKNHSQKEILIFQGFSKLVDEGISLNNIRVADIAKSAGVGKGTVYEYFKSKEEVIAKAILYKMNEDIVNIIEKSNQAINFKEKCIIGFEEMMKLISSKFEYLQILLTNKEIHDVLGCINDDKDCIRIFKNRILELIEPTIELGIKEGIINNTLDKEYIKNVFISVCSGISTIIHFNFGEITEDDIKNYRDMAYTMLIKALS